MLFILSEAAVLSHSPERLLKETFHSEGHERLGGADAVSSITSRERRSCHPGQGVNSPTCRLELASTHYSRHLIAISRYLLMVTESKIWPSLP